MSHVSEQTQQQVDQKEQAEQPQQVDQPEQPQQADQPEQAQQADQPEQVEPETPQPRQPEVAEPAERAAATPKPGPVPTPRVMPSAPAAAVPVPAPHVHQPASVSASFGRVAEDGTVFVRSPDGEREVGSYPDATPQEALAYFARKYDELAASADLLLQRVTQTDLSTHDAAEALKKLRAQVRSANVVGDLAALDATVEQIADANAVKRKLEGAERTAARERSRAQREELVTQAEQIAAQPESKIQWKASGARMRALLDEWKQLQRTGARLDRETETALWQRFSAARNGFDKLRRVHFARLEETHAEAKRAKEKLVKEAEALSGSKDWGPTATAYKQLMDRWRKAGRAARADDDALWERFRSAQDAFFQAKDQVVAAENVEFEANLAVKEKLLAEAESILPVADLDAAKQALRGIQDRWDAAGKVPRKDMARIEKSLRRVESQVREADEKRWASSNPEAAARAQSLVEQLESAVTDLRADLTKAEASGNERTVKEARSALEAREQWLQQARRGLQEFGA
ncbi:DUF349 domain-containing protein [Segeticoccus rhizosphaerae]|uniref:DUF349 domain-containing protein n=1 Tax=Segeticoccus rhizosphaerae TaxID=1104777 RepID=UPI001EE3B973|nr:DUF349 domain-containing protein [Ornithinicoccus soli]